MSDDDARQLFFRDKEHQRRQHRSMLEPLGDITDRSIVDVGCGYGDLLDHLPKKIRYLGTHINPETVAHATRLRPDQWFVCTLDVPPADYIVSCAVISSQPNKHAFAQLMWNVARVAVSFTYWECVKDLHFLSVFPGVVPQACDGDDFFTVTAFK